MAELLHATNPQGLYIKTEERSSLFREIREYSRTHGDANLAVPVIHVILLNSSGKIRMVQRGDKQENPFLWDKAVGGHVITDDRSLPRSAFDENAKKEIMEEVGIEHVVIADDDLHYHHLTQSSKLNLQKKAIIRMIDHDPWLGSKAMVKTGEPWLKRSNVVVYAGLYDGEFKFMDGEAVDQRSVDKDELLSDIDKNPSLYADGVRIFMQRYYHILS
ncbi:MAG: NUDIX domain-containing protein [Magnetococcales bacterium]|nr:NUDIX domain-containing protein [Magnetococcales bacterium]